MKALVTLLILALLFSCNQQRTYITKKESFVCDTIKDPFLLANKIYSGNGKMANYNAYSELLKYERCFSGVSDKDMYYQSLLTYASLANDKSILSEFEKKQEENRGYVKTQYQTNRFKNDSLKQVLKKYDVIILNESHHHPEHRILLSKWLGMLKELGFEYLAVEALFNDSIQQRDYPIKTDGFYVREPHFSNLLREAKKHNFNIISYDEYSKINRDSIAAINLYNKTFVQNPKAKVVVYVGYEHLNEDMAIEKPWLAAYLNILYGINPLTISQTDIYKYGNIDDVLRKDDNSFSLLSNLDTRIKSDLKIINQINFVESYNCFNESEQVRINYKLKRSKNKSKFLILLFRKTEFEIERSNAIPTLVKIIEKKDRQAILNICKGDYIVLYQNENGEIFKQDLIKIP